MDLVKLGQELRERRKALGIPRAELARRVGVTPTYIWMIENAKPRKGGEPSRPGQEVVREWARALALDERYTERALAMAGYEPPAAERQEPGRFTVPVTGSAPAKRMPLSEARLGFGPPTMARHVVPGALSPAPEAAAVEEPPLAAAPVSFPPPLRMRRDALLERMRAALDAAEAAGRGEEAVELLESFVEWLRYRMER